jgi:hypothetical protein
VDTRQRQDLDRYITGNYGEDQYRKPFHSPYWPPQTAHQIFWEQNNCPFVYEYDPADDGPEVEVSRAILISHLDYELMFERAYFLMTRAWNKAIDQVVEESAKELGWSPPEVAL